MGSRWPIAALFALLAACGGGGPTSTSTPSPSPSPSPAVPSVLVITIDGLRPDALAILQPPNLLALAGRGAQTMAARTVVPPNTLPAHASIVSGVDPGTHGITWGDYQPARGTIAIPTFFTIAHAAGIRTALVCGKNVFRQLDAPGSIDFFADLNGGDPAVATEAIARLGEGHRLMLVHFADVDLVGHVSGWMSDAYLRQVGATDAALGRLLAAVPAGTVVILTADHGGNGRDHVTEQSVDMTVPWIIAGPRVIPGRVLAVAVSVKDTAATALAVLGLRLPEGAPSRVVAEAFAP